jgi:Leucine-rich repeat (LRR) protein
VEVLDMQRKELNDLGRLLAMTTGLQVLRACGSLQGDGVQLLEAALVAGADASSSHGSSTTPDTGGDGTHSTQISSNNSQHLVAAAAAAGASSSSASGGGRGSSSRAPLPLLQLDLASLPLGPFHAWLQRRHQLGQLQSLALVTREGPHQQDMWACITAATGLRQLRLETEPATPGWGCRVSPAYAPGSLAALSSSLTHLSLTRTPMDQLQQDPGLLTQLRRLQLTDCSSRGRLCASWVTCLRQLTHLSIRSTWLQPLPEDLGKALPLLEVLVIRDCNVAAPPKGLTRLTRLEVAHNWRQHYMDGKLDMAAVCEATALRQLDLSGNSQKDMYPIQVLSQLEVLRLHGPTNMRRPRPAGNSPTPDSPPYSDDSDASSSEEEDEGQLPHLVNLRHLDLTDGDWWAGELLMIMQDLTFLSLAGWRGDEEHQGAALDDFGAMEGLQQLDLSNVDFGSQWVNACSWVGEHEQLTKLSLSGSGFSSYSGWQVQVQGVAQLPTQLVELDIRMEQMFELPECLSRLTNLRMLLVGGHMFHFPHGQLQDVLQGMQQLEALLIPLPPNGDVVELLVQLPQLRYLALRPASNADLVDQVFDRLPHLSRFSWYDNAVFAHACTHGDEW